MTPDLPDPWRLVAIHANGPDPWTAVAVTYTSSLATCLGAGPDIPTALADLRSNIHLGYRIHTNNLLTKPDAPADPQTIAAGVNLLARLGIDLPKATIGKVRRL